MLDADGIARGPQDIIRTAENYGLMDAIDHWVVKNTLRQLAQDRARLARLDHCSINLSATSLHQEVVLEVIETELQRNSIAPEKICFEITETAAVDNLSEARALMQQLRGRGCRFSLDDFGSGMASYAYLRDLPVDFVKIDRSFISDVDTTDLNRAIVESIVHIASLLGARTVAEGIETRAIENTVTALGVDLGQGYLYGRPSPLSEEAVLV
jgi:EAL domain-containing protein (putative c-di-GMP-specific phosphodiesterase class I)